MLTTSERDQVEQSLLQALAFEGNPKSTIERIFGTKVALPIVSYVTSTQAPDIAAFTVKACLESRWTLDPSMLQVLLEYLITYRGAGELKDILPRVVKRIDPNPSPYDATWLADDLPFFDRRDFRKQVQCLIDHNTRPILQVSSVADSFGRTYSRHFLEHLEDHLPGSVKIVFVELGAGSSALYQVIDLLKDFQGQLGVEEDFPEQDGSAYPVTAAQWMLKRMMISPGPWLLVFDGFGQELNPEVSDTIGVLALRVPTGRYRHRIKLVLLDYPQPLPGLGHDVVREETLPLAASLTQDDLEPCLAAWNAERTRLGKRSLTVGELAKLADGILAQVPQTGKERLAMLNKKLRKLHEFPA